jgi:hypothetical protein
MIGRAVLAAAFSSCPIQRDRDRSVANAHARGDMHAESGRCAPDLFAALPV